MTSPLEKTLNRIKYGFYKVWGCDYCLFMCAFRFLYATWKFDVVLKILPYLWRRVNKREVSRSVGNVDKKDGRRGVAMETILPGQHNRSESREMVDTLLKIELYAYDIAFGRNKTCMNLGRKRLHLQSFCLILIKGTNTTPTLASWSVHEQDGNRVKF